MVAKKNPEMNETTSETTIKGLSPKSQIQVKSQVF